VIDIIVAGAGPAGSVAALVLARAGVRVLIVDRESFPRDKLCGDTLNPGGVALLDDLQIDGGPLAQAPRLSGMLVTSPRTEVLARYAAPLAGRAIVRRTLDAWLLDEAIRAGARFESGVTVVRALADETSGRAIVRGVVLRRAGHAEDLRVPAPLTIAAEGRRSPTAMSMRLIRHPPQPRRWAYGVYAEGVLGLGDYGEMHVRPGHYIGVAPIDDRITNICVVVDRHPRHRGEAPIDLVRSIVMRDSRLRDRLAGATFDDRVRVLGPLAVDATAVGVAGLLLAGDAAGFIDPMTGDGLHLAMRGAVLAATEAITALEHGDLDAAVTRLEAARRRVLGPKLRFNRVLRGLVGSPASVTLAGYCAAVMPGVLRRVIAIAGDAA
jgi:flavin-dependent dehydrogenase